MHVDLGGYHISDIEFTAAFDVVKGKVGVDLADAIWAHPNDTIKFSDVPKTGVKVSRGMTHDGIGKYMAQVVEKAPGQTDDVVGILKETGTDVVVNYLPVGSEAATKWYAEQILEAGVAMVNCMPVFIAREPYWQKRFEEAGCPIIGDDIKSQVGATITHRVLTTLFGDRGVHLDRTMQLNVGGNSDFLNMLERERLESKKISKTNAVTSMLDYDIGADNVHVGPSDYVPWLTDRKWAYIRMEGSSFGDVPLNVELKLEVWDSPNSAGIVIDAVRLGEARPEQRHRGLARGAERVPHEVAAEADPRRRGARGHRALHREERGLEDEGGREGVSRGRLVRTFWLGAAALLVVAALVAIVALLRGELTDTDARILLTLGALFVTGATALAGLALADSDRFTAVGWTVAALAPVEFAALVYWIWSGSEGDDVTTRIGITALLLGRRSACDRHATPPARQPSTATPRHRHRRPGRCGSRRRDRRNLDGAGQHDLGEGPRRSMDPRGSRLVPPPRPPALHGGCRRHGRPRPRRARWRGARRDALGHRARCTTRARRATHSASTRLGAASSATKPTRRCDLSQNGLFRECPQRHRTIALPSGSTNSLPSASTTRTGPSTFSGPFVRALMVTSAIAASYNL